jgi:hypothetical protein
MSGIIVSLMYSLNRDDEALAFINSTVEHWRAATSKANTSANKRILQQLLFELAIIYFGKGEMDAAGNSSLLHSELFFVFGI